MDQLLEDFILVFSNISNISYMHELYVMDLGLFLYLTCETKMI